MTLDARGLCQLLPEKGAHFIDGAFVASASGKSFENVAPAHDQVISIVPEGSADDVERAVLAAEKALAGPWGKSSPGDRGRMLRKIGDLILKYQEPLAKLEALDTGKPVSETLTGDVARSAANFHFFADLAGHQLSTSHLADNGAQHTSVREPIGLVGLITPWNLPLYLATWKLAPALAQGNTVLLKPAELTPLSAMALGQILNEAGLPPGVVNVLQGYGPDAVGEAIVRHPKIKALSFTGETTTGEAIMRAAATGLKKLSFELGGKGATVVFADADLDQAAADATRAAFRNQGQICLAGSRLLVEKAAVGPLLEKIRHHVQAIRIGDPLDPKTTMGSLIAKSHRDKVQGFVEYAKQSKGLEIVTGGRIPEAHAKVGAYFEPTVITGVPQDSRLIQEEIFGPVLTVQTFQGEDEALSLLNGTPYGLSCSVFTRDLPRAQRMARGARMGLVWVNTWFMRDLHTAFGGMKRSGVGREGGQLSLDFFSEMKTITYAPPAQ